ncbi:hypothetical protein H072_10310 [Dactylellina haptotyla CBS 200.50]|uniref:F-box domain-containing protein n=1 Tax=Dactylellina haptotyla (strain CBS 200.50) TaxID=1284197 RepID=S8A4W2_DACHA|nr:hypothetical protein H072_10310 [Dactylellina haptotyla CBS 200.50]
MATLVALPRELQIEIFSYISFEDQVSVCQTCSSLGSVLLSTPSLAEVRYVKIRDIGLNLGDRDTHISQPFLHRMLDREFPNYETKCRMLVYTLEDGAKSQLALLQGSPYGSPEIFYDILNNDRREREENGELRLKCQHHSIRFLDIASYCPMLHDPFLRSFSRPSTDEAPAIPTAVDHFGSTTEEYQRTIKYRHFINNGSWTLYVGEGLLPLEESTTIGEFIQEVMAMAVEKASTATDNFSSATMNSNTVIMADREAGTWKLLVTMYMKKEEGQEQKIRWT